MTQTIKASLEAIRQRICASEREYARVPGSVQLLAVSKTFDAGMVRMAYAAGQRHFAENYLQEALAKIAALADLDITWHFIGPIQSNKTRAIATHFDWVHTVDRANVALRLNDQRPATLAPLNVLLQVNVSNELSKSGVALAELATLAAAVACLPRLQLRGLMTIPAPSENFAEQRRAFHLLAAARADLQGLGYAACQELSMGMSQDFQAAIAEGATMVRIGTAIFGARQSKGAE